MDNLKDQIKLGGYLMDQFARRWNEASEWETKDTYAAIFLQSLYVYNHIATGEIQAYIKAADRCHKSMDEMDAWQNEKHKNSSTEFIALLKEYNKLLYTASTTPEQLSEGLHRVVES